MVRRSLLLLVCVAACGRIAFDPDPDAVVTGDCSLFVLTNAQMNLSSRLALDVTGANAPVTFALEGPGMMSGTTFISPPYRSQTTITATDRAGCTATAIITTAGNQAFYIAGSVSSIPTREVWRGVNATSWTKVGDVPAVRVLAGAAVFHDAMWFIGGSTDESVTGNTNVWTSTDGIGWTLAANFPVPVTDTAVIGYHDRLWLIGGHGNPGGVWSSPDGVTWTKVGMLPAPLHGGVLVVLADQLVYLGGHDDSSFFDTEYASSDGVTWASFGTLPVQREFQATAVHDGTVIMAGGAQTGPFGDSYRSTDGVVWMPGGTLPSVRTYGQLVWITDRYYLVGGTDGGDVWSSLDATSWQVETSSLLHPRYGGALLELTAH